jgi:hypothetical protein
MIDLANGLEKIKTKATVPTVKLTGTVFCRRLYLLFGMILRVNSDYFAKQRCLFI